ncbi:MAG: hypothetical protein RLN89_00735, partial [Parvibaculum sp.]
VTAGEKIPHKRDLPLRGLAPFMPRLMMHRRDEDGFTHCLLFGTALSELFGRDLTGSVLEEAMALEDSTMRSISFATYAAEHGKEAPFCRYVRGTFNKKTGSKLQFESLAFPYVEDTDRSMRSIVYVMPMESISYGDSLTPQFSEQSVHMFHPDMQRPDWLQLASAQQTTKI